MPRPTASDIAAAIELVEAGEWIDPYRLASTYWRCELYDPENKRVADGVADTPGEAMGLVWIAAWWLDALISTCRLACRTKSPRAGASSSRPPMSSDRQHPADREFSLAF
jgi:hypothetical protein